jgi:glycosyltransferase involved in cell wall biosynthesis
VEENRLGEGSRLDVEGHLALAGSSNSGERSAFTQAASNTSHSQTANSRAQHICIVTETYPPEINGVASTLAHLVNGLLARGNTVSLVHPKQQHSLGSDDLGRNCHSEAIQVRGLSLPGYHGLQFGMPARRILRQSWRHRAPAVVYVATEGPLGWSAIQIARQLEIPTISGFHTNFHHYCRHYGMSGLHNLALRYLRWFHNQTECTVVSNQDLRDQLHHSGFNNVTVVERGVDSHLFAPQRRSSELRREWGLSDNDIVALCVGRIAAEKNLSLAIEAYRAMARYNDRLKFVIVGDGPLRQSLQREHSDVIFAGIRTGKQLARYYASADLFLFPSETETFGNVTLEAMASGLAVIAYDYAAAKLHVTHGQTGILVRFGDANAFVEAACSLIRGVQAIQRIRRQAREQIIQLSWPRVVEHFEAVLMSALRPGASGALPPMIRGNVAT